MFLKIEMNSMEQIKYKIAYFAVKKLCSISSCLKKVILISTHMIDF